MECAYIYFYYIYNLETVETEQEIDYRYGGLWCLESKLISWSKLVGKHFQNNWYLFPDCENMIMDVFSIFSLTPSLLL